MNYIKRILLVIPILLLSNSITSQIKLISSQESQLVGEVRNPNNPYKDFQGNIILDYDFVASLSFVVSDKRRLYKLKFRDSKKIEQIEFYATKSEIESLYKLIYNDFSKPQMEFKTKVQLGKYYLTIGTDWLTNHINRKQHVLALNIKDKGVFTLDKLQLKNLFGQ